ncbi:hypothetical protein [Petropleomorpha daqingensis]|uniref:Uncharacterized protein n=1 Tax=Petropleomorpha daqingensis TaxID=2026353 RepID=A0A853CCM2_9ACTN|nr:hypothetical protein [Petropleomorpha daqingensis]NYJ04881.1 hypothetical protein [Petropleomorpha daqingensis]
MHPLVAEGMARRGTATASHRTVEEQAQQSGEVGWPAPPNKGHGLGWPGDLSAEGEEPAQGGLGWLLGTTPAA